jgi:hypothetical protein
LWPEFLFNAQAPIPGGGSESDDAFTGCQPQYPELQALLTVILQGFKHFFTISADHPDYHAIYLLHTRLLKKSLKVSLKAIF